MGGIGRTLIPGNIVLGVETEPFADRLSVVLVIAMEAVGDSC
jgi:hypothetical protein